MPSRDLVEHTRQAARSSLGRVRSVTMATIRDAFPLATSRCLCVMGLKGIPAELSSLSFSSLGTAEKEKVSRLWKKTASHAGASCGWVEYLAVRCLAST